MYIHIDLTQEANPFEIKDFSIQTFSFVYRTLLAIEITFCETSSIPANLLRGISSLFQIQN